MIRRDLFPKSGEYRKLRAYKLAKTAVDAPVRLIDLGRVIAFGVEPGRLNKYFARAVLYAEAAALATVVDDVHVTYWHFHFA
jgi:hypothetical protein